MRKVKIIQIEDRGEVTVKEISPYGLYQMYQAGDGKVEQLQRLVDDAVSPGIDVLKTWYPSEQEQVLDAFLAVNGSFFEIARKLKVDGLVTEMRKSLESNLSVLFADSFRQVTATPGVTDGQSL